MFIFSKTECDKCYRHFSVCITLLVCAWHIKFIIKLVELAASAADMATNIFYINITFGFKYQWSSDEDEQ